MEMSLMLYPRDEPHNSWDPDIPILWIYSQEKYMHIYNKIPIQEYFSSTVHYWKNLFWKVIFHWRVDDYDVVHFTEVKMNKL